MQKVKTYLTIKSRKRTVFIVCSFISPLYDQSTARISLLKNLAFAGNNAKRKQSAPALLYWRFCTAMVQYEAEEFRMTGVAH
jgi:hypothetical protein